MIHSNYFDFLDNVQPLTRKVTDFVCQHFLRLAGSSWKITCTLPMNWCLPLIPLLLRGLMIHHPIYPATMFAFQVWLGTMQMKRVPTLVLRSPWRDSVSPRVTWWLHASSRWKWMKVNMLKPLETNNINAWENRDSFGSWGNHIWFNIIYLCNQALKGSSTLRIALPQTCKGRVQKS